MPYLQYQLQTPELQFAINTFQNKSDKKKTCLPDNVDHSLSEHLWGAYFNVWPTLITAPKAKSSIPQNFTGSNYQSQMRFQAFQNVKQTSGEIIFTCIGMSSFARGNYFGQKRTLCLDLAKFTCFNEFCEIEIVEEIDLPSFGPCVCSEGSTCRLIFPEHYI